MKNNKVIKEYDYNLKRRIIAIVLLIIVVSIGGFVTYEKATVNNTYYISEKNLQIPVFVYHDIVKEKSEVEYDYMQTTYDTFKSQINGLMDLGYKPISYQELKDYSEGKIKLSKWSFVITFDDGYTGVYNYAYQFAKEKNIPMTSFLINDQVGKSGFYTWEQAKEMNDSGLIGIYSHTYYHNKCDGMTGEEVVENVNKSYEEIEEKLEISNQLKVFTYPEGRYTKETVDALKNAGYMQNLTDNKVNMSNKLNIYSLHREYPLEDSVFKILLKTNYRVIRYRE